MANHWPTREMIANLKQDNPDALKLVSLQHYTWKEGAPKFWHASEDTVPDCVRVGLRVSAVEATSELFRPPLVEEKNCELGSFQDISFLWGHDKVKFIGNCARCNSFVFHSQHKKLLGFFKGQEPALVNPGGGPYNCDHENRAGVNPCGALNDDEEIVGIAWGTVENDSVEGF